MEHCFEDCFAKTHSRQKKNFWLNLNEKKFDNTSSILDADFVLMPQKYCVIELSKFVKRCLNGFFLTSSIGHRCIQTVLITIPEEKPLLPRRRNNWGSRSPFYRACEQLNFSTKIDHLFSACIYKTFQKKWHRLLEAICIQESWMSSQHLQLVSTFAFGFLSPIFLCWSVAVDGLLKTISFFHFFQSLFFSPTGSFSP